MPPTGASGRSKGFGDLQFQGGFCPSLAGRHRGVPGGGSKYWELLTQWQTKKAIILKDGHNRQWVSSLLVTYSFQQDPMSQCFQNNSSSWGSLTNRDTSESHHARHKLPEPGKGCAAEERHLVLYVCGVALFIQMCLKPRKNEFPSESQTVLLLKRHRTKVLSKVLRAPRGCSKKGSRLSPVGGDWHAGWHIEMPPSSTPFFSTQVSPILCCVLTPTEGAERVSAPSSLKPKTACQQIFYSNDQSTCLGSASLTRFDF
jgi:hypothetical protein